MEIYEIDYALSRGHGGETKSVELRTWGNFSKSLFFSKSDLHASRSKIEISLYPPKTCVVIATYSPSQNFVSIRLFSAEI